MYYETDRVLLFISWILCYSFFTDVGNVFKLVIFFKCVLFCYGLFRFRKCWKLFSRRLPVIYIVIWTTFRGAQSFRQRLTCQVSQFVIQLFFVRRVQKTLQTSILPTRNWLNRLLVLLFVLLSAPGAEHRKSFVFGKRKTLHYKSRFVLLNSSFVFWLAIRTRQNMARLVKNIQGYNKLNWLWSIYLFGFGRRTYGNLNCDVWLIRELRVHKRVTEITGKREVQILPRLYNV